MDSHTTAVSVRVGYAAGMYLGTDHADSHPMTQLVVAFKLDRTYDDAVADQITATHVAAGLARPDVVGSAPVTGPDRFTGLRSRVPTALADRAARRST